MARAYIVLARNDIDESLLQVLDLIPNSSQFNPPYDPPTQTGYLSHEILNTTVATTGATNVSDTDLYGLGSYLKDKVENTGGGNVVLTDAEANTIATSILDRVAAGQSLELADINTLINAPAGVSGSDLDGSLGASVGSVEEVLRILSGEVWLVPSATAMSGGTNAFAAANVGYFVTAPNIGETFGHPGGRKGTEPLSGGTTVAQDATDNANYRSIRQIADTGDLRRSAVGGKLSILASSSFTFVNPSFTYTAAGTATDISGTNLTTGAARAVTVYAADGSLIV